ncbi:NADH-quinone oxidoreductase subunit M [Thermodesulforhabdus norvegica]|uniref:NADH dehydrogenase subunit M n=1 Tax=Thermodesulforhabdus norvegica TaxID=39841 RepID=A0A1I4UJD8_9BACT|nr:NADH-quinone oxidoreductase subunit M [Thermodesulforhabdus norvegica]SFM89122.1 NADH dehydrogenase subunit M [Thermodesulforhabdus norvegica]
MDGFGILSLVTFFPLVGVPLLFLIRRENVELQKQVTLAVMFLDFLFSLYLIMGFDPGEAGFQFVEKRPWIESIGATYFLGIDGISLWLYLLTTFTCPICILSAWRYIDRHVKEFLICMLVLEVGMLGTFCALDLLLFYVFWELMLIPMYFIIGVWGGPRRVYAAIKFVLYTLFGSVLMLAAIIFYYLYVARVTGEYTFDLLKWYQVLPPFGVQIWLFAAFALSFAIKVPMFPFHTWLPDAHVEAPTPGSVILAGILLKMGTYGFIRFAMGLFPHATHASLPLLVVLSIIGVVYGALVSIVQPDVKKLVAFSSVSHLGAVMLGLFALNMQGVEGGIYQMLNHGLSTGALFILVGMLYERRHTRLIKDFGGVAKVMPIFAAFFMITVLSSVGLPGLNGFIGEFLIFLGAFKANPVWTVTAATCVILAAVYLLWMFKRVMFGPIVHDENRNLPDLNAREIGLLVPITIMYLVMGVFPNYFLGKMHASVEAFLDNYHKRVVMNVDRPTQPLALFIGGK